MMFTGPEYASYIALTRELRLEREWQNGDWYGFRFHVSIDGEPLREDSAVVLYQTGDDVYTQGETWWLPRLDQWLDLLEEADARYFRFYDGARVKSHSPGWHASCLVHDGPSTRVFDEIGPTREEAVARLWMIVVRQSETRRRP